MTKLTDWLSSISTVVDVKPIRLTIRGTQYEAASYVDTAHMGNTERIMVLGKLPACYRRSTRIAFRTPHDARDWYVAAYMSAERITPELAPYHPCGENFLLVPWNSPHGAIDDHNYVRGEYRKYRRIPVTMP